jgi:uncharacterized membrane protein YdjX (TVP38/TMEM64 family)
MTKKILLFFIFFSIATAAAVFHALGRWELSNLQSRIENAGFLAPLIYMVIYAIATALILPSTMLNLAGGALFGIVGGMIWTSLAAIVSAILTFWTTRLWMRSWIQKKIHQRYRILDQEISEGGIFYLFAVRLLPVIPYGIVNYSSGLTSISFRDYLISTTLGTVLGLFPFVMLGNSGVKAITTGEVWHILIPMTLIGLLIIGATWSKRHKIYQTNSRK